MSTEDPVAVGNFLPEYDRANQIVEEWFPKGSTPRSEAFKKGAKAYLWGMLAGLAPNGIQGEILAEALEPINDRLARSANETEWLRVGIDADMGISADGGRPYALLSESERWRADAMIAEAVSHLSGVRLLVLDRVDVLDLAGREDLLYWLDGLAADGEIETAILFATLKALPANLPENIEAIWIENGIAGKVRSVA